MTNSIYLAIVKNALTKEAERLHKPLSWFRYATINPKSKAYTFLPKKEDQLAALESLASNLVSRLPDLTTGQIVDMLSEIVNG